MERRYMISDASKMVDVESHVLRYWEEELEIEVPRNEMGHRYYTDYYINLFKSIKELKDQGFLLKAIKMLMPKLSEGRHMDAVDTLEVVPGAGLGVVGNSVSGAVGEESLSGEGTGVIGASSSGTGVIGASSAGTGVAEVAGVGAKSVGTKPYMGDKMQQFQMILTNIVVGAMEQNNESLSNEVSTKVSESVIKEMDYLLRLKEEREEERFKKIDELIRNSQKNQKEAVTGGKRGLFRKK